VANSIILERGPAGWAAADRRPERRRVYIFLTRYGLLYAVNLGVMLVGAVNYNNSLAYALTFLLGGLFLVSMLHTYSNLRGLMISASAPDPVFAGRTAVFPLLFDNRQGRTRIAISLALETAGKRGLRRRPPWRHCGSVDIAAASLQTLDLDLPAQRRGYLVPGRIRIASTWPLGLFRAWSYMQITHRCTVYPRPLGSRVLPVSTRSGEDEQTGQGSGTDDFIGFRQYQSGDSMRVVDWKAYARERGLVSKRFSGRGTRKVYIDWQQTAHLEDREMRLSQLCLWVLEAQAQQARYALVLPGGGESTFSSGDQHRHRCLEALAGFGTDDVHP